MAGMQWGCRVLGKGDTESRQRTGREREGEGSNAQRLLTCGRDSDWKKDSPPTSPTISLVMGGGCEVPQRDPGLQGWGFG